MKEPYASHPLREYTVLSRLERVEQEIHAFRGTFLRDEAGDSPRSEQ